MKINLHIKVKCDLMVLFIYQTNIEWFVVAVWSLSHVQRCNPMNCNMPGSTLTEWLSYANHSLGPKDALGNKQTNQQAKIQEFVELLISSQAIM